MWLPSEHRKKLFTRPLPADWIGIIRTHLPYYNRLFAADRAELGGHVRVFLAEKRIEGCAGFGITDEIRVCIAANACLLLLHRETDYFPRLQSILVYPDNHFAPFIRNTDSAVLAGGHQPLAGESAREGVVALAWSVILHDIADAGRTNVILHEFAHQLDGEDDFATREERYAAWVRGMQAEYDGHRASAENGHAIGGGDERETISVPSVLREYGAGDFNDFFAAATEAFFGQPRQLLAQHPSLYAELKAYYQQDPAV